MDLLPVGRYLARAVDAALSETKTGKVQVVVRFELLDEGYEGHSVMWYGVFATESMSRRIIEGLRACGWYGDDLSDLSGVYDNQVEVEVEHSTWEGRTSARVRWVNEVGGSLRVTPLAPDRARAFAARMRHLTAATKPPARSAHPAGASSQASPPTDEPIPF